MRYAIIILGLLCSMSFAQVSAALDSIEENIIGFAVNGQAKGGILSSTLSSEALVPNEDVSEYSAFTDFLLNISVRPSNETKASFDLRFHKDWQSAYREGNNTPIIRWWSYDGNILDKSLKFNLGTMRLAYTPLTIYLPEPDMIMEPEVFSEMKREAMEDRYLDGTNRRLLQGLNLEYKMSAGIFDKIFLQGTVVRLRKVAEAGNRVSFDFDPNKDRFSAGARAGIETQGIYFGVNEVYTFNRFKSSLKGTDTIDYEKNNVLSVELNYNSKKLLDGPVSFGIGAEYALSGWSHWQHTKDTTTRLGTYLIFPTVSNLPSLNNATTNNSLPAGTASNTYPYYETVPSTVPVYELSMVEEVKSQMALLGNGFVQYKENPFEVKLSGHFLKTDKNFESELAASPAYLPNLPILNSDAALEYNLQQFRTGSLENMYYSLYYTLPLTAITIVSGSQGTPSSSRPVSQNANLDNNYKLAQYYRNSYTQQTYTRLERAEQFLDPSVNLALPYGYATPDRTGGDVDLNFVWNKAVSVRGVFGKFSSEDGADYTRFGGGVEVNIARLADFSKPFVITGSYEQSKGEGITYTVPYPEVIEVENKDTIVLKIDTLKMNPQTNRIMAGFKVGIWRGLSLLGGFQQLTKEFVDNPYLMVKDLTVKDHPHTFKINKTSETLVIGGPQIKISERANFNLQGGLLSNAITFVDGNEKEIDLKKYIISSTVTVEF